jgi:hypothetical protein
MADRRSARTSHVRPRPPSSGRPAPVKVRPRAPAPGRLSVHTPIRRSRGIPLVGRVALAVAVVAVGLGVLYVGARGIGTVVSSVGGVVTGFVEGVTATPVPSATPLVAPRSPSIASPSEPYTNQATVDLAVTVDPNVAGDPDYHVRVYLALEDQAPAPIQETPVAPTPQTIIPVQLTAGINDFAVTLIGPGGESESSPLVRYVLDESKPAIKLDSPKDGATVNRKAVDLQGRTQGRSTLMARNVDTGESIGGAADGDGAFELRLPIAQGRNDIVITATDPAGNVNEQELSVNRGSGELSASLSASAYKIKKSALPAPIRLTATVDDPDGRPLAGAAVTFTLSVPGIKTVTGEATTDADGQAVFETTIPESADRGGGNAAVLVRSEEFGRTTDDTVISITK